MTHLRSLLPRGKPQPETADQGKLAVGIFLPLLAIYLATASYGLPYHIDPLTNVYTAWKLGAHGTVYLDEYEQVEGTGFFGQANWLVRGRDRVVSKYPPGAPLLAAPLYAFADQAPIVTGTFFDGERLREDTSPMPSLVPAAIIAALTSALAVTALGLIFRGLVSPRAAWLAAMVTGLGTTIWAIASNALWQHGPTAMWMAFSLLALSRGRTVLSGTFFAFAIITRPQTAIIIAVIGVALAWSRRSVRILAEIGVPAALGLGAFLAFNMAVFGTPLQSDAGGYFIEGTAGSSLTNTAVSFGRALFHPKAGLFMYSPFLLPLALGLAHAWRTAPVWIRASAVGGFLYLVMQLRGNVWDGGGNFFGYRYPIEMLVAAAPLLLLSWREWGSVDRLRVWVIVIPAATSVAYQGYGALAF